MDIIQVITQELGVKKEQVEAAVKLIDEGNTIPFISRYRKEATGALNDEQLRNLYERLNYLRNLEDKKKQVLASIEEQGKLNAELKKQILEAQTLVVVEDLYRPYRPKRRTRATIAKEKGLENVCALATTDWDQIAEFLFAGERKAEVRRTTKETDIYVALNLDGSGICDISTGLGFFDHMLEQIGKHSGMDLTIRVKGDLEVDEHHTIEDTAIALGECINQALGSKRGIERYGYALPMDDCLCQVCLDFGGRPWLVWDAEFKREKIGEMPTEMFLHFFKSLSDAAKMNLNVKAEGQNEHHKIEGIFKALARALKMAIKRDIYHFELPSSKGVL